MQSFELNEIDVSRIKSALEKDDESLKNFLGTYHASEIAILFESLESEDRKRIINILPIEVASEIISEMDAGMHPEELLQTLSPEKRSEIVEELDYDDATDIISQLSQKQQDEILEELNEEDASNIRTLLAYPEDSAGGIMNTEFVKVHFNMTKKDALDEIVRQSEEIENFNTIYVVDERNKLLGLVSLKKILKAKPVTLIENLYSEDVVFVNANTDQEEVAKRMSQYNISTIPVVNDKLELLGIITIDDVIDVLEEENTEDILKISGVSEDEELSGTWRDAVKSRLPWLVLNLGTAFLAASVIRHFEYTVTKLVIVSSYMTMIANMGGNTATQALAVTVRRISLNDLTNKQAYKTIFKELTVGLVNGAVIGSIVCLFAYIYDGQPILGMVVFLAMTGNLLIAGIAGSSIPLFLKRIGIDPAVASSIIITTFTDFFGFLILLGLATRLLL